MQLAEYYMAVRGAYENPDLKLILLDRTLAGDLGHLIWSVNELIQEKRCMLEGIGTEFGTVSERSYILIILLILSCAKNDIIITHHENNYTTRT